MEQVADGYALRADEVARHKVARRANAQIAAPQNWWVSGGRESTFLYMLDRKEILLLLEANGMEAQADITGRREITCMLDLYNELSQAQDDLRRVIGGESLETVSDVDGRVFETHLIPIRNQHHEVSSILCIAFDVTEGTHPLPAVRVGEKGGLPDEVLRKQETQMQTLLDAIPDHIFLLNRQGDILNCKAVSDNLPQASIGTSIVNILPSPVVHQVLDAMQQARETRSIQVFEYQMAFGETVLFNEVRVAATEHDELVCIVRNITERTKMELALRSSEERYRMVISNAPIVLFATDASGVFTLTQGRGLQAMGLQPGQLNGLSAFEVYRDFPHICDALHRALAGETLSRIIHLGDLVFDVQYTPLRDAEGQLVGLIGLATDISERVQAEDALQHQVLHDTLTDLPNRTLLLERIAEVLPLAEQVGGSMALLMLDLDRFKEVNDTFGHQFGDQLLQQVAERFRQAVSAAATVARLGGDEFAVFLPTADEASARQVASALGTALEEPFLVEEYPLQVEASIGIALYPAHGSDPLTLFRRADVAMYTAKRGHEGYALYDAHRDKYSPRRLALLGDLRKAIATHELRLYYQPKAELRTGLVKSVEALIRWQHPTHGFIPPDQFIPLAEQTGLIGPLTHWVVATAVQQCRHWLDSGLNLSVAVNLSMSNLRDTSLPDTIADLLARYRVPPNLLCCEITESAVMADADHTLQVLNRLFALGVRIAIDDYGTGYASLSYLKHLPADELKIDRAFVQHVTTVRADEAIVRSTVSMAHRLGIQVVAEGVEDQVTWNLLEALGCDIAQGYYLSRPVPAQDLEHWLCDRKAAVAH